MKEWRPRRVLQATLFVLLVACGGASPTAPASLAAGVGLEVCAREPYAQLRITCLVETGARAGREGDAAEASEACAAVPEGTWRDECHFRSGEELGRAGRVVDAYGHCGKAGRFATFCLTHAGWGIPPDASSLEGWLVGVQALPEAIQTEGADILRGRWWFNHYFGTGEADPAAARAAGDADASHARGAWALEAVRLTEGDLTAARTAWVGGPVLTGPAVARRLGRYDAPFKIAGEEALPRVRTYGSGLRLVGGTAGEDLEIALLEALYFRESTGAGAFRPFLDEVRPRVRYTALRWYRTLPDTDSEAVLSSLRADPDPIVRAHVADALKYRTWRGKRNAPGLK